IIWRYMNFDKFKSLVAEKILYFCSIDTLKSEEDPYEGSYYASEFLNDIDSSEAKRVVGLMNQCGPPMTVNCWHLSDDESMAMWKLYAKDNKGIAIQSTVGHLKKALCSNDEEILIGEIKYTDDPIDNPANYTLDKFSCITTKRRCYNFEKELRAFVWDADNKRRTQDGSLRLPVEVDVLIDRVLLAPTSLDEMCPKVKKLLADYRVDIPIAVSSLLTNPKY
ncbi:hypothetical protein LCGC14_3167380, partial [marine sediment metagenome]